jgi:hypothetical protein
MGYDDNTARGGSPGGARPGPIVRSTAPAGTPARRSPDPPLAGGPVEPAPLPHPRTPSDRPVDTLTPPRTVGGHTARLNVPEGDSLIEAVPGIKARPLKGEEPAPESRTVGGTVRMNAPSPEESLAEQRRQAAQALAEKQQAAADEEIRKHQRAAAREATAEHAAKQAALQQAAREQAALGGASVAARPSSEPSTIELLFAPISVAVGLVFFAMGAMIALTVDGRLTGASRAPAAATTAAPTAPPPATATPTQTAAAAHTAPTAVTPATATAGPTAKGAGTPAKPPPPPPPGGSQGGKTGGKSGLPF